MSHKPAPFDRAAAANLMERQRVDLLLPCSRANAGYLADHTKLRRPGTPNIEDMVLVTEAGCEPLTVYPRELRVFR